MTRCRRRLLCCRFLSVPEVAIVLDERQYQDMLYLAASVAAFHTKEALDKLRPTQRPKQDPRGWWQYAVRLMRRNSPPCEQKR